MRKRNKDTTGKESLMVFSMRAHAFRKTKKGFSLLEVMIVVFIFTLMMVVVTAYFAKMATVNQTTKQLQRNLEDVQLAFNLIGKTLRTAVVVVPSTPSTNTSTIRLYDYSQRECIEYAFSTNSITARSISGPPSGDEKSWCQTVLMGASASIVSTLDGAQVFGKFLVTPSTDSVAGRVTMMATVKRGTNLSSVQTTVSLRNFREHL